MIDYDTFPIKKFFKILHNEDNLQGLSKEDWTYLKKTWNDKHQTQSMKQVIEAHRKVIVEGLKLERNLALFKVLLTCKDDPKEYYEAANVRYHTDPEERIKYLNKEVNKSKQKLKIFDAQREQLEKQIAENQEEREDTTDINEVLASLELHGFNISDYETLTLGKYDAMTKVIIKKEKAKK